MTENSENDVPTGETISGPDLRESKGVTNPLVLIERMIQHGSDPDTMKKMMDLAERWQANRAREIYHAAMNQAQAEMGVVVKNRVNVQTQSRYANLEAVNLLAKPIYTRHGFSLSFGEATATRPNCWKIFADVKHTGGHQERYEGEFPLDDVGPKGNPNKTPIQAAVSSGSYAARILITRIFNLTIAESDVDGQATAAVIDELQADGIRRKLIDAGKKDEDLPFFLSWVFNQPAEEAKKRTIQEIQVKDIPRVLDMLNRAVKAHQEAKKRAEVAPA